VRAADRGDQFRGWLLVNVGSWPPGGRPAMCSTCRRRLRCRCWATCAGPASRRRRLRWSRRVRRTCC